MALIDGSSLGRLLGSAGLTLKLSVVAASQDFRSNPSPTEFTRSGVRPFQKVFSQRPSKKMERLQLGTICIVSLVLRVLTSGYLEFKRHRRSWPPATQLFAWH
eukprot:922167-Amphidinium_carterae.1